MNKTKNNPSLPSSQQNSGISLLPSPKRKTVESLLNEKYCRKIQIKQYILLIGSILKTDNLEIIFAGSSKGRAQMLSFSFF